MIRITLYRRADCELCEEMRAAVVHVARRLPVTLDEVDVDSDPELAATYGAEVPVLAIAGRKIFAGRVDPASLEACLRREPG